MSAKQVIAATVRRAGITWHIRSNLERDCIHKGYAYTAIRKSVKADWYVIRGEGNFRMQRMCTSTLELSACVMKMAGGKVAQPAKA